MNRKLIAVLSGIGVSAGSLALYVANADADNRLLKFVGLGGEPITKATQVVPATPRKVRVVHPDTVSGSATLTLSGRTAPAEEASLSSRASGIVAERRVDIGDNVKAGDILVTIDAPEVEQELLRARATVSQMKARLALADVTLKRGETLVDKGHVSVQTVDERRTSKEAAAADLAAAEAEVKRLEDVQSFQTIRAPFDGTIVERNIERGDKVSGEANQGNGYLLRIARLNELRIEIDVPQSQALVVKPGARAQVSFLELPKPLSAKIVRVSGQIDASSSTMRAELLMPNPGNRIPAGLNGQVSIDVNQGGHAVTVPTNVLITRAGHQVVAVVDADNRVQMRRVQVARDLGERVVITSGLTPNDRVIVSPNALIRANDLVAVAESTIKSTSAAH